MEDKIFLLSVEEYEKYKERIPYIKCWWWLRSPGSELHYAMNVTYDGSAHNSVDYDYVNYSDVAVRPVIRREAIDNILDWQIGNRIVKYDFPWFVIDKDLAIAEVPISFHKFDTESNDYENSEIRKFLFDWLKDRSN